MKKVVKRVLIVLLAVFLVCGIGFGLYVSDYYEAKEVASEIAEDALVNDNWIELESDETSIGFIFYPGAKVEYTAYLPLLHLLQEEGISCYLVEMPFNLAFFGYNKASDIIEEHPEIDTWYIGGHSLGGAFASYYASNNQDEIEGVILLGSYLYGDYPSSKSLTIYGSNDEILDTSKITYTDNVYVIEGGNHGQFGDYGLQDGDGQATISAEEQWQQTIALILDFMGE